MIIDLSYLKYIDIDGIETLKFVKKLSTTKRLGFIKMRGNQVFDKSDFVRNSEFFDDLQTAIHETVRNGPVKLNDPMT